MSTSMSPPQPLHVAIVCAGHNSSRDVITLVKSMLFYRYSQVLEVRGSTEGKGTKSWAGSQSWCFRF